MTFPSFVTTGGTVDIPTVPLERKALDLTPLIQQLMMNKKASSTGTTAKGDEKDPEIKGTTGQTEQWYDNYARNQQEIKNLVNWYGTDVVTSRPEYRRLINEQNEITNPAVKQRLENNKQRLDAYDALVKEKGASGLINMDMLGRTGVGLAHSDWSYFMQRAQTPEGLKVTRPGEFSWMEDFSFTSDIATFDDALKALYERYAGLGTSEFTDGGGSDNIYQDVKDDWVFLVTDHNTYVKTKKSNDNIYGENPRQIGQLEAVKQQALQRAFSGSFGKGMEGDDMASGLAGKFLLLTSETVPASKVGLPGNKSVKAIFQTKAFNDVFTDGQPNQGDYLNEKGEVKEAEYKKAVEDWNAKNQEAGKNYYKTHDGYYFKAGTKDENGNDIGGTLDQDALLGDYQRFIYDIVDAETNKRLVTVDSYKSDQNKTVTALDTWQQDANDKKAAELDVAAANEQNFSVGVATNLGILENDFQKLFNGDEEEYGVFEMLTDIWDGVKSGEFPDIAKKAAEKNGKVLTQDDLNQMTFASISPFVINKDQNGKKTYLPNPDFSGEKIDIYKAAMKEYAIKEQGLSESAAESYAQKKTEKAINAHKTLNDNYIAKGVQGMTSYDGTKSTIVYQDEELIDYINKTWFDDVNGNKIGKTADALFNNQLVQVGTTVVNGSQLFGNAFRYEGISEEHSFVNFGLAANAGAKAKYEMTINGEKYKPGAFIHLSVIDQMTPEQVKDFNTKVDYGSNGYWNVQGGMATQNSKPNKTGKVYGMGKNSEMQLHALSSKPGANAIAESGTSITSNVTLIGKEADVLKYWKENGTTLTRQMPAYAKDEKKKEIWEESEKAFSKAEGIRAARRGTNSVQEQVDAIATNAGITKGSASYNKLFQKMSSPKTNDEIKVAIVDAIAESRGMTSSANWDKKPILVAETIVDSKGRIKDFAKSQLYLQEEKNSKGEKLLRVTSAVEVQAQMAAANKVKSNQKMLTYNNQRINKLNQQQQPQRQIIVDPITEK